MSGELANKVALVTGAGSGIGRASAIALAAAGATVVVSDVDPKGGAATVGLIEAAGGAASFVAADVTRPDQVAGLIGQVVERYGRLDCAHNNAGIEGAVAPFHEYPDDAFDQVIAVNLKGVWLCLKAEIVQMLQQGHGTIVNTASVAGLGGSPTLSAYGASKHGVVGLTRTLAQEYAKSGLRINAVCPAFISTPMVDRFIGGDPERARSVAANQPMGRTGTPEEVAAAVVWLCSDAASFISGHCLAIDGGRGAH
jgi:NAD(P)-dependent dehydrogenase (short-subunit alcohol dehydrogenase family)